MRVMKSPVASSIPFDNTLTPFSAEELQGALEEIGSLDFSDQTGAQGFSMPRWRVQPPRRLLYQVFHHKQPQSLQVSTWFFTPQGLATKTTTGTQSTLLSGG